MGLYLVLATRDLRLSVSTTCTAFYTPCDRLAVIAYAGDADELARRLDLGRSGGSGKLMACMRAPLALALVAGLVVAGVSYGVLT